MFGPRIFPRFEDLRVKRRRLRESFVRQMSCVMTQMTTLWDYLSRTRKSRSLVFSPMDMTALQVGSRRSEHSYYSGRRLRKDWFKLSRNSRAGHARPSRGTSKLQYNTGRHGQAKKTERPQLEQTLSERAVTNETRTIFREVAI